MHAYFYTSKQIYTHPYALCKSPLTSAESAPHIMALSGKRFDDCVSRFALIFLFFFCIVGFLLGIVFIYLNVNDRISKLEENVFPQASDEPDILTTATSFNKS